MAIVAESDSRITRRYDEPKPWQDGAPSDEQILARVALAASYGEALRQWLECCPVSEEAFPSFRRIVRRQVMVYFYRTTIRDVIAYR
jgi:hypothetical protein